MFAFFFFFNDPATTEIYTLSLHDALPIYAAPLQGEPVARAVLAQPPADREQPDCAGGHAGQPQLDRHAEALVSVLEQKGDAEEENDDADAHDGVAAGEPAPERRVLEPVPRWRCWAGCGRLDRGRRLRLCGRDQRLDPLGSW